MSGPGVVYPPLPATWNVRNVNYAASPVTALAGDWIRADTSSGPVVVNGPETSGATWGAKKISSPDTNNLTVQCTGGGNIDGAATQVSNVPYFAWTLIGNGSGADIES